MDVTITLGDEFKRNAARLSKRYRSLPNDLRNLKQDIINNPLQGDDLGGGVRKIRMAIQSKGKGKSGGARVLTLNILVDETDNVTLLTIYDKNEIQNVSDAYIRWLVDQSRND